VADRVASLLPPAVRVADPQPTPDGGNRTEPYDEDADPYDEAESGREVAATRLLEGPLSTVESRSTVESNRT